MRYVAVTEINNEIILQGDCCCTELKELYIALTDTEATEIVISKEFANKFFTYTSLCDFVEHSAAIVPHIRIVVEGEVYDKTLHSVQELMLYRDTDEFIYAMEHNPDKFLSTIKSLCKSYMEAHNEVAVANNKLATVIVKAEDLQQQLHYADVDYESLLNEKNLVDAKLHSLVNRVNYKYEKTLVPDELFQLEHNSFTRILYLKETSRVHYTDTLLYYLQEILKTLYSMPVRTVVIEPFYSYGRIKQYPGFKPHWDLTYRDVYSGNIYMAGFQGKVMNAILQNPNHVNYLIVLDRGGYAFNHIIGGNVVNVDIASDIKDLPEDVNPKKALTYSDKTLFIPYIDGFEHLSPEDKILKYSSMGITKELIKMLEEGV